MNRLSNLFIFILMLVLADLGCLAAATEPLARSFSCKFSRGFIAANRAPMLIDEEVPVVINEKVDKYIRYFQSSGRKYFSRWLSRSGKYIPMMKKILEEENLPPDLVYLAMIESGFNNHAVSDKGAVGPWQFIDSTGRKYGLRIDGWVDERKDPEKSTRAAAEYLRDLYVMFASWELAAAGYNAGEERVQAAINKHKIADFWAISKHALPEETKNYVPKLYAALTIARSPEVYGFSGIEYQQPEAYEKVKAPPGKGLRTIAKSSGVSYEGLKLLNPALIKGVTPPDAEGYEINVPVQYQDNLPESYGKIEIAGNGKNEAGREAWLSNILYANGAASPGKQLTLSDVSMSHDIYMKEGERKCALLYNPHDFKIRDKKGDLYAMSIEPSDLSCAEALSTNSQSLDELSNGTPSSDPAEGYYALDLRVTEIRKDEVQVKVNVYRDFFSEGVYECSSFGETNRAFDVSYFDPLFEDSMRLPSDGGFALVLREVPKDGQAKIGVFVFR